MSYRYSTPRQPPNRNDEAERVRELQVWEERLDELEARVGKPGPTTPAKDQERKALEDRIAANTIRVAQLRERLVAAQKRQVVAQDRTTAMQLVLGARQTIVDAMVCSGRASPPQKRLEVTDGDSLRHEKGLRVLKR